MSIDLRTSGIFHVVESQLFAREFLEDLFSQTDDLIGQVIQKHGMLSDLAGNVLATLFYEPSTRTRLSFESAMIRLGGKVVSTENAKEFSSAVKGETLEDTIRVVAGYADVIVLRHNEDGASWRAVEAVNSLRNLDHPVSIVNAGDGAGQHPTQALLDIYTIRIELHKDLNGISVAMCGDLLNGRTVRSLCYLLSKYAGIQIYFVAPDRLQMKDDIRKHLKKCGVRYENVDDIRKVASCVDVIYQTRTQLERGSEMLFSFNTKFIINQEVLDLMHDDAIIMHPLPRVSEISPEVDNDPRAVYFRQAHNGLYVRMALLKMIFGK